MATFNEREPLIWKQGGRSDSWLSTSVHVVAGSSNLQRKEMKIEREYRPSESTSERKRRASESKVNSRSSSSLNIFSILT